MVVFRLTQEEYTALQEACKSKGGRNLSEFTRTELLAMLRSEQTAGLIQTRFQELERKLAPLEAAIAHLTDLLACGAAAPADLAHKNISGTD
jgi:hypothetical protein